MLCFLTCLNMPIIIIIIIKFVILNVLNYIMIITHWYNYIVNILIKFLLLLY